MSRVDRVRQMRRTWGTNAAVVHAAAAKPSSVTLLMWGRRPDAAGPRGASQRRIAVLLERQRLPLVAQHLERRDQPGPRVLRLDHVVQVAQLGGDPRRGELLVVLVDLAP